MSNFAKTTLSAALLSLLLPLHQAGAEDTDIYAKPASASAATNPNVLIVLDNSANWTAANQGWGAGIKQGQSELNAIRIVAGEQSDRVNIGLMMGTDTGTLGGYVRFRVRPMTFDNKVALRNLIGEPGCVNSTNIVNDTPNCIYENFGTSEKVNSVDYSAMMFEVFKYFGGYTNPDNAHAIPPVAGTPWDALNFGPFRYAGAPDPKTDKYAFTPTTDPTLTVYDPPIGSTTSCAKSYVILIGNGFPGTDSTTSTYATRLAALGGDTTQLPLNNINETTGTVTTTSLLETTACGTYASIAACETAAATKYGAAYDSYSCTLASTCPAGASNIEEFGTTLSATNPATGVPFGCNYYADAAKCISSSTTQVPKGIPLVYPGRDSYSCTPSATTCDIWVATTATTKFVANPTACITTNLNTSNGCTNYGNSNYPNFRSFSCNKASPQPAACSGNEVAWVITALETKAPGTNFAMSASTTVVTSADSYEIRGTKTVTLKTNTTTGTFSDPTNTNRNYADEWARFLNRTDVSAAAGFQNISVFTIDVYKDQPDAKQSALLMSMARNGGGKYFVATDEDSIKNALRTIISEIQAVNSVFASSSLPVSVNTQGTYLNQVFMGMFRPDSTAAPRWAGNLKQYKFKIFNGILRLSDATGNQAISVTTGFVTPCATSFWSSDTGTYWDFPASQALGDCSAITSSFPAPGSTSIFSDAPDGEVVEKGGVAQQLRGVTSSGGVLNTPRQTYTVCSGTLVPGKDCRNIYTCDGSSSTSCTTLNSFDTSNTALTATALNCTGTCVRNNLINWIRGQDVDNENENFDTSGASPVPITNEVRPSVHGGVVHSHPGVVDYGATYGVVAFYGADDGVFHAIKGNQGLTDGYELWSFIAPEHWAQFNRLKENGANGTARVDFPGVPSPVAPKQYGFDGGISIYQRNTTVWLFSAMRRGGRAIYAFDVSNPTAPTLKWRKGCFTNNTGNDTNCSTGWSEIGQTWSEPLVNYIPGSSNPVLIFGGGYDTCEDVDSAVRCTTTPRKGAGIWFVDANTGNIIRKYTTHYSVPGDVTVMEDSSGYATHVYATDTGGNVYRINVGTYDGATLGGSWSVSASGVSVNSPDSIKIAALSVTANNERKFMNGPAVVKYGSANFVLVGSGDREHPLIGDYACNNGSGGIANEFFMVMDRPNTYATPATAADLVDVSAAGATFDSVLSKITDNTGLNEVTPVRHTSDRGWRFSFGSCEQLVNKPLVVGGVTYFGTNAPSSSGSVCSLNLGNAYGYAVDFLTGNPVLLDDTTGNLVDNPLGTASNRSAPFTGGGMPPSPVAGVVDVDGTNMPFCIGCIDTSSASASALEGSEVKINPVGARFRPYWYIETD